MKTDARGTAYEIRLDWMKPNEDEDYLMASLSIEGLDMHVQALRVSETPDGLVATLDPHGRLEEVEGLYQFAFASTEIPGFAGRWIVWAHPHAR